MDNLIALVRALAQDLTIKGKEFFTFDVEYTFILAESNLISDSIKVFVNNTEIVEFEADYDICQVKITKTLTTGDSIRINYNHYEQYSDTEIEAYILSALAYISVAKVCSEDFLIENNEIYPTPEIKDRRLIGIVAGILINGNLRSFKTPDFSYTFNETDSKEEKIRKVIRNYKSRAGVFALVPKNTEE